MNAALLAVLRLNSRVPDIFIGDLNAQIAACTIGKRRLAELAASHGAETLVAMFAHLIDRSEAMTRAALRSLPAGTYGYHDFLDNDGVDLDARIRIEVAVTVRDGGMLCDFAGTSGQVRGPFNMVPSGSFAAASFAVRALLDPDIPTNEGCFRPIALKLEKGSILDPIQPAPVGCRALTAKRVAGCILGALRAAAPDRIPADASGELVTIRFGGRRADGSPFVTTQHVVGGSGAGEGKDGVDVIQTDLTNGLCVPAEAMEQDYPIRVHEVSFARDSGGPGRWRGGLGAVHTYEMLNDGIVVTYRGERHYVAARGADGGQSGGLARAWVERRSGGIDEIPSKAVITLKRGDRLVVRTAGGGGFGPPAERATDAVAQDLANRKISADAAGRIYAVADARVGTEI
jgi:N-methylhydantoinase B/oxoprolinase/acetone carboxylase alpha subunit